MGLEIHPVWSDAGRATPSPGDLGETQTLSPAWEPLTRQVWGWSPVTCIWQALHWLLCSFRSENSFSRGESWKEPQKPWEASLWMNLSSPSAFSAPTVESGYHCLLGIALRTNSHLLRHPRNTRHGPWGAERSPSMNTVFLHSQLEPSTKTEVWKHHCKQQSLSMRWYERHLPPKSAPPPTLFAYAWSSARRVLKSRNHQSWKIFRLKSTGEKSIFQLHIFPLILRGP